MDFRLLGPLEVWDRGRPLELTRPKLRALLAFLLLRAGAPVTNDALIDALWGERAPPTARAALQNYVAQLRRVLGPGLLESRTRGYVLNAGPEQIDLGKFERLVAESRDVDGQERAAKLSEALALWQGPPLADLAFEPFAAHEISRLEDLRTSAFEDLIDAQLALGAGPELLDRLEALIAEHPFRERLRAQQMLALYRDGRQADALVAYQETRRALVDGLGIEPGSALRELEAAILRQDPSLEVPKRSQKRGPAPAEQRRKVVTILFADLACPDTLDPELLRKTSMDALARMQVVLERHGATVEQRGVDEVMAVFGVPRSHEDDPLRAARAAQELRSEVARLSQALLRSGRGRLELRVGIATGQVLAEADETTYGFVSGPAVTLAKRILQAAGPDEVLLGPKTIWLLGGAVVSEPSADGRHGAGLLVDLVEGVQTPVRHPEAPLVGRAAELGRLHEALAGVVGEGTCRRFLLVGEAGIGKTRLVREFVTELDGAATVLVGHCVSYGRGATYVPLAEMIDGIRAQRELAELLAGSEHAELIAARLADLTGEKEAPASGGETFWAARRLFEALAGEQPLVLVFEDLHWAEPSLLDLLDYLAKHIDGVQVLLLGLARPELLEVRAGWAEGDSIALAPLSLEDGAALIKNVGEVPAALRERLLSAAGGNPLFIEQLLAHAKETGETESMPLSLEALLASRLDRLEAGQLSVLQRAAVVGREFRAGAVVQLVAEREASSVHRHLLEVSRKGLLEASPGEETFRFRHVLIRDAAYATLPKAQRAELHERFAHWLASHGTGSDELIGFHFEQAHDYLVELGRDDRTTGALATEAGERLSGAGLRAAKRGDMPAASGLLTRATSLLDVAEVARRDLLTELGLVVWRQGELGEAQQLFERAVETAAAQGDRRGELRARTELEYLKLARAEEGASEQVLALAAEAIPLLEQARDDRALGRLWFTLASVSGGFFCRYRQSSEEAERALEYFRRSDWPLVPCLQEIGAALYYGPTPVPEATDRCRALLQNADRGGTAQILVFLAGLEAMAGRFDDARACAAETRQIYEDLAWTVYVVTMHAPISADIELLAGNSVEAERILSESCRTLEAWGIKGQLATQASRLAEAVYAQGRDDEAIRWSATAQAYSANYDIGAQFLWRAVRGKALARQGAIDEGEKLAREATELAAQTDSVSQHAHVQFDLSEVLRMSGRDGEAAEASDEAIRLLEKKGNVAARHRGQALLA